MQQAQAGDKAAYGALLEQVTPMVEAYLYKRVSVREDVPDIAQEILMSIHKARHSYESPRPFAPWLYAICHYRLQDYFRQVYRCREDACEDFSHVLDALAAPADDAAAHKQLLGKALSCLNDKQRTIIETLYLKEQSAQEVADQLGISVPDVRTSAHRAMKRLRHAMEGLT